MHETIEQEEIAFLSHKILDLNKKLVESEKLNHAFYRWLPMNLITR